MAFALGQKQEALANFAHTRHVERLAALPRALGLPECLSRQRAAAAEWTRLAEELQAAQTKPPTLEELATLHRELEELAHQSPTIPHLGF